MRKFAGILLLCCASMALAQNITREGVRGSGIAKSEEGKRARFSLWATKTTSGDRTVVGGSLELHIVERDARRNVGVVLPVVKRLAVTAHHAEFGGPGVLVVMDGRNVRRIPGHVVAAAADLGVPADEEDDADTLRVHFTPQNPDGREFHFAGALEHGDIAVHSRP
jgi:hypothetical protein